MSLPSAVLRAFRKPPRILARRLADEAKGSLERFLAPRRARGLGERRLLGALGELRTADLWCRLAEQPYPFPAAAVVSRLHEEACPGDAARVVAAAERALLHRVDLFGSGPIDLGPRIDWSRDFKTGISWPPRSMRDIPLVNRDDPSDVKVPWELSRLQWLLPAGQAYLSTGDERYAAEVRSVLEDWIGANPYSASVNWTIAMEAALRILTWTWFFHVFHRARAWANPGFRSRFLRSLYLHGDFTERHLEYSDVNGNHCTADAAGLVFAGLFFGRGKDPERWQERGWSILCRELPRQVYADGVDFEASVAYHRLVLELFLLPALYREACGLDVPAAYRERIIEMARFSAAYSRPEGTVPLWGDADDGRALPLGGQDLNDHRYLAGLVGAAWDVPDLLEAFGGNRSEVFWLLGREAAARLPDTPTPPRPPGSRAFPEGGFFVMRNELDHVFIDCGPIGLAGRGGHGHNDCLSFEAVLMGVPLVSDCGAYVYTADFAERNRFRSTASHNTPVVDGQEMNGLRPELLWVLEYDARPELRRFETGEDADTFCGAHAGYGRLVSPVTPVRTIVLDHQNHRLLVRDAFEGEGVHRFEVPLHLAPGVEAREKGAGRLSLTAPGRRFRLGWEPVAEWSVEIGRGRVSPRYGVAVPVTRLVFRREGPPAPALSVRIEPEGEGG